MGIWRTQHRQLVSQNSIRDYHFYPPRSTCPSESSALLCTSSHTLLYSINGGPVRKDRVSS